MTDHTDRPEPTRGTAGPPLTDRLRHDLVIAQAKANDANTLVNAIQMAADLAEENERLRAEGLRLQRLLDAPSPPGA